MNTKIGMGVRLLRTLAWALLGFVAFATLSPIGLRPETGHVTLERFGAFFAAAAVFTVAYPRRRLVVVLGLIAAAGGLEALQNLEPDRHGRVADFLVKATGVLAGALAGEIAVGVLPVQRSRERS